MDKLNSQSTSGEGYYFLAEKNNKEKLSRNPDRYFIKTLQCINLDVLETYQFSMFTYLELFVPLNKLKIKAKTQIVKNVFSDYL